MSWEPYDSLGRILAAGGASTVALGLAKGMNDAQLRSMIRQRFGNVDRETESALIDQGYRQSQAALAANSPANRYRADPSAVPINAELFGDDPEGRRQRSTFIGTDADGNEIIRIGIDFPDVMSPAEQMEAALERMCLIIGYYPQNFPGVDLEECDDLDVTIIDTSRRF